MKSILDKLINLTNSAGAWTRVDVGIACYLFSFMIEVAWTLLSHCAFGEKPNHFTKQSVTPFAFHPSPRHNEAARYHLKDFNTLPPEAGTELIKHMSIWMPYFSNKTGIVYNEVGFWICALRFAKDVGTHRSLCLVQHGDDPAVIGMNGSDQLNIKVPVNPATKDYTDTYTHMDPPIFSDSYKFSYSQSNTGFCYVSASQFGLAVAKVAFIVHDGLAATVAQCAPKSA